MLCNPGARLVDMVVTPHALVEAGGKLRLHAIYYITKQIIPALERVLNLVGADPRSWFVSMTKPQRLLPQKRPPTALPLTDLGKPGGSIGTIDQYYLSRHCAVGFATFQKLCHILEASYLAAQSSRSLEYEVSIVKTLLLAVHLIAFLNKQNTSGMCIAGWLLRQSKVLNFPHCIRYEVSNA